MDNIEKITKELLIEIGEDPKREGLLKTPERVSKSWEYLTSGYKQNIKDVVNGAIFDVDNQDMIIIKDINYYSLCEHHMIPFYGKAHIGYIPNGKIIGLSKLARITDLFSQRLQVQERLTIQVVNELQKILNTDDVACVIDAKHLCVNSRGINDISSSTVTAEFGGKFKDSKFRRDFLDYIKLETEI